MVRNISLTKSQQNENQMRMLLVSQRDGTGCRLTAPLATLDGFELVGETSTCQEALRQCRHLRPDVILVDVRTPQTDDLIPLPIIHNRWPRVQLVVLASRPVQPDLEHLHETGVVRCLFEDRATQKLAGLIQSRSWDQPHPPAKNGSTRPLWAYPRSALNGRERQILGWMIAGQSDLQIAERLGVNELTARLHVQNALGKLRAVSLLEAVSDLPRLAGSTPPLCKARIRLAHDHPQPVARTKVAAL